jgi:NADH-quinone oxidoreductase E subunit
MEFRSILTRYPTKRAALLPTLHLAQREFGYISSETLEYIASLLELTPAEVWNAVSFYSLFYRKAMGMYVVQVCQTLSCSLLGAQHILDHLVKKLGINPGETTSDKRFSLLKVECLGSCGTAPVMRINDEYYENLTTEKIDALLDSLS